MNSFWTSVLRNDKRARACALLTVTSLRPGGCSAYLTALYLEREQLKNDDRSLDIVL